MEWRLKENIKMMIISVFRDITSRLPQSSVFCAK